MHATKALRFVRTLDILILVLPVRSMQFHAQPLQRRWEDLAGALAASPATNADPGPEGRPECHWHLDHDRSSGRSL